MVLYEGTKIVFNTFKSEIFPLAPTEGHALQAFNINSQSINF